MEVNPAQNSDHRFRYALKIVGASGQGINTVGEIIALALKRAGLYVFAYREYPSLIKGGHATYQIDFSNQPVSSYTATVDAVIVLNKQATKWHLDEMKPGGIIFHDIDNPRINTLEAQLMRDNDIKLVYIPALKLAQSVGGNEMVSNIVSLGYIWKILKLDFTFIEQVVRDKFASKPQFVELDINCLKAGFSFTIGEVPPYTKRLIKPNEIEPQEKSALHCLTEAELTSYFSVITVNDAQNNFLITGNEALAIGAINAGVRIHYGYPMTPSSSILTYLAENIHETGMIVKQAEDEITAAAMALGSMHMGARALTATSGGGFDLMTEHVSLAAITEIPFVCVLAQRPGPATGLPTWTTQGDLLLAIFSAHGEFARCVLACADAEDAFYTIQEAFNIAEEYQIPVIVLTDKLIAETYYSLEEFDQSRVSINRGELISSEAELSQLKSEDRYALTETGISKRWVPGSLAKDYNANSDEHDEEGNVTEEADMSRLQIEKRIRKQRTLLESLPQPELLYNDVDLATMQAKLSLVGWGSSLGVMKDVMKYFETKNIKVDYLHIKYLWPLKTDLIVDYLNNNPEAVLIENNHNGQLGQLIKLETGLDIRDKLLRWDGRPFNFDEVVSYLETKITQKGAST